MVVTNVIPGAGTTAGNALEKIIKSCGVFYEINFLVVGCNISIDPQPVTPYRTFFTHGPQEDWSALAPFSHIAEAIAGFEAKKIGRRINSLIKKLSPEFVILDIQSHSVLLSLEKVDFGTSKSIIVLWDHWSWRYEVFNSSNSLKCKLDLIREKLLRLSEKIVVPSQAFKQHLIQHHRVIEDNVVVLYLPIEKSTSKFLPGPAARHTNKTRIVGFAGQQYAQKELRDLLQAVERINDLGTQEYKIEVHIFSKDKALVEERNLVHKGFVNPLLLVEKLIECEILFLPYPFASNLKFISELSFPSKFTSYLESRRPVIFYGPSKSPLSQLLFERHYPFLIGSPSIGTLVHVLYRALDNLELQYRAETIIEDLINEDFSVSNFKNGLDQIGLLNLFELQQVSVQNSSKMIVWNPRLFSNGLLRVISPLLPLFLKMRLIRHRLSFSKILFFLAEKLKVYFELRNIRQNVNIEIEKDWQKGTI